MKAFVAQKPGLENAILADVPAPVPRNGEVLVRLHASSLNHLDLWLARGHPSYPLRYPQILGSDGAGTVEAAGPGTDAEVGQSVVVSPLFFCGRCDACRRGLVGSCDFSETLGAHRPGTHAEYVAVPKDHVFPIHALSFEQAACLPVAATTALHMLKAADVQTGQTVLVWAASGSVGSFAIQIAKKWGANVLTTAGTEKVDLAAKTYGIPVIDYQKTDVGAAVRQMTSGRGVDAVLEFVGPATWRQSARAIRKGGTIVTCGAVSGPAVELDLRWLHSNQIRIVGTKQGTPEEFRQVRDWAEKGELRPVIGSRYPLSAAQSAFDELEKSRQFGKIVLTR